MKAFISLAIFCLSVASVSAQFSRSLVIAFDVTVSMGNKLAEMKEATHFLVNRSQEVHTPNGIEFVLAKVPLHMTGPPQLTQKPAELRQWIKEMGLHLNPDDNECPERTMSALKDAISHARTHSLVYLFTDADPKDPELMNEVLSAAKSKNIEINVIMSMPHCNNTKHYQKITEETHGKYYNGPKDKIIEFLKKTPYSLPH